MTTQRILSLLLLSCCGPLLANAVLTTVPANDAVMVGSTVVLSCTANQGPPGTRIMWTEFAGNSGGTIVSDGKTILSSHPNSARYSIIGDELDYHLEIRDVQLSDGGTYLCQDINSGPPAVFRGYAELVVLESDPVCQDFVTVTGVVIEGNSYSSECEINYKGNLFPRMAWEGPGEFVSNGSTTAEFVWSWKRFTAHRDIEGEAFTCLTDFGPFTPINNEHAANIPTYNNLFTGPTIHVRWGPQNIQIDPIKPSYNVGETLTCTVDSNPAATYTWTNMRTFEEFLGQTFTVTANLAGFDQSVRCHAQNFIEGSLFTQDAFVNVSVPATTTQSTTLTTTPSPADGPCNDPTGQWSSTNPNAVLCVEMDSKGNLLTLLRNGSDPYFVAGNGKTNIGDYKHIGFTGVWPTGAGVGGFTGECHNCYGNEVILMSGLSRNKAESSECGTSAGTHLTRLYVLTRSGPPCRGLTLDVHNPKPWILEKMGVIARPYKI